MSDTPRTDAFGEKPVADVLYNLWHEKPSAYLALLALLQEWANLSGDLERALAVSNQELQRAEDALAISRKARERAEKDAKRYRWLNNQDNFLIAVNDQPIRLKCGEPLDRWIDAAMNPEPQRANISRNSATNTEPTFTGSEPAVGEGLPPYPPRYGIVHGSLAESTFGGVIARLDYDALLASAQAELAAAKEQLERSEKERKKLGEWVVRLQDAAQQDAGREG